MLDSWAGMGESIFEAVHTGGSFPLGQMLQVFLGVSGSDFLPPEYSWDSIKLYGGELAILLLIVVVEAVLIVALFRQLRERRKAEISLRESEERIKIVVSAAEIGMWILDTGSSKVWASSITREFVGWEPDEDIDFHNFIGRVFEEDRPKIHAAMADAIADMGSERDYTVDYRVLHPTGKTRMLSSRGRAYPGGSGGAPRLVGITIDITERRQVESDARMHEVRFQALFDGAAVGIVLADVSGRPIHCNPAMQRFLGYSAQEFREMTFDLFTHPEDVATNRMLYQEMVEGVYGSYEFEKRYVRKNGEVVWGRLTASVVRDMSGEPEFVVAIIEDVTRRRQAEGDAEQLRREISHYARVTMMGELTAAIAHELNQPLSAILSNSQAAKRFLAQENPDLKMLDEILDDVISDDKRASEVISRLRKLLRKGITEQAPLDLNEMIREVVSIVRTDARMKRVSIRLNLAPDLPLILGDKVQLQQVMLNLLVNAVDAMNETPQTERRVTVVSEFTGAQGVRVSVRDRGSGIDPDKIGRIFEPFFSSKAEGMGMGLSICNSIMQAHGGRISARNNLAGGATFEFSIPALEASK